VQEFLNTQDLERFGVHSATREEDRDGIRSPEQLRAWLAEFGLAPESVPLTGRDVARAAELRAGLRAMVRAAQGLKFDGEALRRATDLAGRLLLSVRLEPGRPRLQAAGGGRGRSTQPLACRGCRRPCERSVETTEGLLGRGLPVRFLRPLQEQDAALVLHGDLR
jgi:hypothetical protein